MCKERNLFQHVHHCSVKMEVYVLPVPPTKYQDVSKYMCTLFYFFPLKYMCTLIILSFSTCVLWSTYFVKVCLVLINFCRYVFWRNVCDEFDFMTIIDTCLSADVQINTMETGVNMPTQHNNRYSKLHPQQNPVSQIIIILVRQIFSLLQLVVN